MPVPAALSDPERRLARPAALLPAPIARLAGFCALAMLGALEWQRMVDAPSPGQALLWVLVGGAGGLLVLAADRRAGRWRGTATVAVAGLTLLAAFASAGLDLGLLRPARWTELGDGIGRGLEALGSVRLPYAGGDPWPVHALELGGALLCALAGLLALWPRDRSRGYPFISLAALLVLVATPVVSLGGAQPVFLGMGLTALTVAFLWLERLPMRPGVGVAAMLGLAVAGALPVATMADRGEPWFDYKAFAEGLGTDRPVAFNWDHDYGGITWGRDGVEIMRVRAAQPSYWKVRTLSEFDGLRWRDAGFSAELSGDPELELPNGWEAREEWTQDVQFILRRLRTDILPGAGTTLNVSDASRPVRRRDVPGQWEAVRADLRPGDSYTARVHVPRPAGDELAEATSAASGDLAPERTLRLLLDGSAPPPPGTPLQPLGNMPISPGAAEVTFPPFGSPARPEANYKRIAVQAPAGPALRHSNYARAWSLAQELRAEATTPYEYVLRVMDHLRDGYTYTERPPRPPEAIAPLEHFLMDARTGYCQQFSAGMALLLRMGGVPARVAAGFSPGGFSKKRKAWIVRDNDAHSWVEVWFDQYGWVAFDPTPPATPARSQIGAIEEAPEQPEELGGGGPAGGRGDDGANPSRQPGLRGEYYSNPAADGDGDGAGAGLPAQEGGAGGVPWLLVSGLLVLLVALALGTVVWRRARRRQRPSSPLDRAVLELELALRRSGRPTPVGTTLRQIERRLGDGDGAAYIRALRAARYGTSFAQPDRAQRRALRRELAAGAGWAGRLRALWALPPRLR